PKLFIQIYSGGPCNTQGRHGYGTQATKLGHRDRVTEEFITLQQELPCVAYLGKF
ncbi:hypothetical protein S83_035558, partial [Arachis hypogaea]